MPRTAHQQQSQQNQEMGTTNGSLEKRLAYFLIQEMLPSEIIEGEGFKVSFACRSRRFHNLMPFFT